MKRPEASITSEAFGALEFEPSHTIFPSFAAIAHLRSDDETATTPFLITRSAELKIGWGSERLSSVFIAIPEGGSSAEARVAFSDAYLERKGRLYTKEKVHTHA
jgi:hypothetical protein